MSYEKKTWATGDIINAEDMNRIEGNIISVNFTQTSREGKTVWTCDMSSSDIRDCLYAGMIIVGSCITYQQDTIFAVDCGIVDYTAGALYFKTRNSAFVNFLTNVDVWTSYDN